MQIFSNNQIGTLKKNILQSVEQRSFDEYVLETSLQQTFPHKEVEVFYDNDFLMKSGVNASYVQEGVEKHNFIFKENYLAPYKGKNLEEIKKIGKLQKFATVFEDIAHEAKHAIFADENISQISAIYFKAEDNLNKKMPQKIADYSFKLSQKSLCANKDPKEFSELINRLASKVMPFKQNEFKKFLGLQLLLDMKDEKEAYIEGFKAKKDILGDNAKFFKEGINQQEAKKFIEGCHKFMREVVFHHVFPKIK